MAGLLLAACGKPEPPPDWSAARALAEASVAKDGLPSLAYAVVRDGAIIHEGAVNSTVDTPYPLASATKPIIATALMVLAEQGALDLDQPALRYLGRAPASIAANTATYTVRQLLSHTAGLGTYARIYWKDRKVPVKHLLQNLGAYGFTAQPPGTVFEYSNLGYGLLGELIAAKAGVPLGHFLDEQVFKPLGMSNSMLAKGFATPAGAAHKYGADGKRLPGTANDTPGAGNVYASAHDLALFAAFSLGADAPGAKPVLSKKVRRAMQTAAETQALHSYYGGAGYGLGWYVRDSGDERVVWHEGGMPGASSIIVMLPQRRLAAVVLANANDVNAKVQEIANALLLAAASDYAPASFVPTEGFARFSNEPAFTGRWVGRIEIDGKLLPWTLEFAPGGAVHAKFPPRKGKTATPRSAHAALVNGPLLVATFPGDLPGRDVSQRRGGLVLLRMMNRDGKLTGMAVAYSSEQRLEHLYPFRAELVRDRP